MRVNANIEYYRNVLFEVLIKVTIICLSLNYGAKINAAEITCSSGYSPAAINSEITPANITVGSNIPDYTVLYTMQMRIVNNVSAYCYSTPSGGLVAITAATLTNLAGPGDTSQPGYIIFPTNVNGIGISVNSLDGGGMPIPAWPAVLTVNTNPMGNTWRHQNVKILFWKTPGDIPSDISPVGITGPTVIQGIMPATSGDYLNPTTLTPDRELSPTFWMISQRNLVGSAKYYVGTCNLRNSNQTVLLGKHFNFARLSDWHDASFYMDCPVIAWGYGGSNYSVVNGKNKAPSLKIVPYSAIVVNDFLGNPLSGTIALDAGGAQGYGVQLAWGDYTTQTTGLNPAKPVPFNTPVSFRTLVGASYPTEITLGKKPDSALIKMAARFIQIDATPHPGPARAAIEVIASYE